MWLIGGKKVEDIAQSIAAIEPAFSGPNRALIIDALEARHTAPIMQARDLEAAFDKLPFALQEAITQSGSVAWSRGALSWRQRTEQVLQLLHNAGNDVAIIQLLQLLFGLDLRHNESIATLDLSSTTIPGHLILRDLSVAGDVYLEGLHVMGAVDARRMQVSRGVSGEQARYLGPVWLAGSRLKKAARFGYSQFQSDFDADSSVFGGGIWLRHASIQGEASFSACVFGSDSSFGACRYSGCVTFAGATFQDTASFEGATFESNVSLNTASFSGKLFLRDAAFKNGVTHEGTRFLGEVIPPLNEIVPIANKVDDARLRLRDAFKN